MLDAKCVHEAGHVIVLRCLFTRNPTKVVIDQAKVIYEVHSGLMVDPIDSNEVVLYCAYFWAGREAVERAVALNRVPQGTNPDHGFSDPPGDENDSAKLGLLSQSPFSDGSEVMNGASMAKTCIERNWDAVCTLAKAFETDGTFMPQDIDGLIGPP